MTTEKLALCDVSGPLKQLTDCLGGNQGQEWLDALKLFLRRENPWQQDKTARFATELVVPHTAVTVRGVVESIGALRGGHIQFDLGILQQINADRNLYHDDYGLLVTTPMQMGLGEAPALEFILERANGLGWAACPAAVVAHVVMHHPTFFRNHDALVVPLMGGSQSRNMVNVLFVNSSMPHCGLDAVPISASLRLDSYSLAKQINKTTPLLFVRCIR